MQKLLTKNHFINGILIENICKIIHNSIKMYMITNKWTCHQLQINDSMITTMKRFSKIVIFEDGDNNFIFETIWGFGVFFVIA